VRKRGRGGIARAKRGFPKRLRFSPAMRIDCLMPTLPGREAMREIAIKSFGLQEIPEGWQVSLVIDHNESETLGAKLNRMVAKSSADFLVLLDDDDWHHPYRVMKQVRPLLSESAELTGTSKIFYFDRARRSAWLYSGSGNWLGGMAFTRQLWDRCHFDDVSAGVDTRWQKRSKAKLLDLANPALFVAGIHERNTCWKNTSGREWREVLLTELPIEFISHESARCAIC